MTKAAPARAEDPVVFVIDDDPSMREALRSLFQSVGWRVELFGLGARVHARARAPTVQLALCLTFGCRG